MMLGLDTICLTYWIMCKVKLIQLFLWIMLSQERKWQEFSHLFLFQTLSKFMQLFFFMNFVVSTRISFQYGMSTNCRKRKMLHAPGKMSGKLPKCQKADFHWNLYKKNKFEIVNQNPSHHHLAISLTFFPVQTVLFEEKWVGWWARNTSSVPPPQYFCCLSCLFV